MPLLKAQKITKGFTVSGIVIDENSGKAVSFCHIYNESRRKGFISDSTGRFNSYTSVGDTLVFIVLGYFGKTYKIQINDTLPFYIKLTPRTYEIGAVSIGIPRNYSGLKTAILDFDTRKNKPMPELPEYNPFIRPLLLDTNVIYKPGFMIMHPVSGIYYRFNKEEKSKRQVRYLQEQELKQPLVDDKFNRNFVSRITGLTGDDLNNFIGYCNFSFNYLYNATPLEIVEAIDRKYNEFKKCCLGNKDETNTGFE